MTPIELWDAGQRALSALGRSLTDQDAEAVVPACPDWTVRQVFAHQAGVAADILGGRLDGVATDPWTARQVEEREGRSLTEILDEWDADAPRLVEVMAPLGDAIDPRMVMDLWTHDQDVRGAVGRPGERGGERGTWVADRLRVNLHRQVEAAGLAPIAVDLGDGAEAAPGGTLRVPAFEFVRGTVGRRSPGQIRAWDWGVQDPDAYAALVAVFPPRPTDLVEPDEPT